MTVQSAQSITVLFTTRVFATGVGTNADSLPTGTLYLNGTANGASVTVTNISTGLYKAQVTMPTLAVGDVVNLSIAATVSSVSDKATIWSDSKDLLTDASGFVSLSAAAVQSIWDALTSALTTASSIGKLLVDNINATISSRMATYTQPTGFLAATFPTTVASTTNITAGTITTATNLTNSPTNGDLTATMKTSIENTVWNATMASHITAGSTGNKLNSAGSAGDPWSTLIPASYAAGTAGFILGNNLDIAVSSRLAGASYTAPDNTSITAIKANTDNLPASPAAVGSAMTLTSAYDFAKGTTTMTESYAADAAAMTPIQALYQINQHLGETSITGTTKTVKKRDGTTTAKTFTLNDATTPTSITETT